MKQENSDHQGVYAGFAPAVLETVVRRPNFGDAPKAAVTMAAVAENVAIGRDAILDHSNSSKA